MNKEQTQNKKLSTQTTDSITEVNFCLDEPRGTCSFKGNKKLWKAFVSYSKLNYGSVCHCIEPMLIAVLSSKVNLSNTIRPLNIENLNIERAVKRVRRYAVEEEVSVARSCVVCGGPAQVVCTRQDGSRVCLCKVHFVKEKMQLLSWRILDE